MKEQISQVLCTNNKHKKAPIEGICFDPTCKKKDLFCGICLTESHSEHLNQCKGLDEIEELVDNSKRIQELLTQLEIFSAQTTSKLYKIRNILRQHICDVSPINDAKQLKTFSDSLKSAVAQPKFNIQKVNFIIRNISDEINSIISEVNQQEYIIQPINFIFQSDQVPQRSKLSQDGKHLIIKDKDPVNVDLYPAICQIEQPEFSVDFNITNITSFLYIFIGLQKHNSASSLYIDQYGKIRSSFQKLYRGDVEDGNIERSLQNGDIVRFTVDRIKDQVRVHYPRTGANWVFDNVNANECEFFIRYSGEISIS